MRLTLYKFQIKSSLQAGSLRINGQVKIESYLIMSL